MSKPVVKTAYRVRGGYSYGSYDKPTLHTLTIGITDKGYTVQWAGFSGVYRTYYRKGEEGKIPWSWTVLGAWQRFVEAQTEARDYAREEMLGAHAALVHGQAIVDELIAAKQTEEGQSNG